MQMVVYSGGMDEKNYIEMHDYIQRMRSEEK